MTSPSARTSVILPALSAGHTMRGTLSDLHACAWTPLTAFGRPLECMRHHGMMGVIAHAWFS